MTPSLRLTNKGGVCCEATGSKVHCGGRRCRRGFTLIFQIVSEAVIQHFEFLVSVTRWLGHLLTLVTWRQESGYHSEWVSRLPLSLYISEFESVCLVLHGKDFKT